MVNKIDNIQDNLFNQAVELIEAAKSNIVKTVNSNMVLTYFGIGRMIVEEEQNGHERAEYGKALMVNLSQKLQHKYRKGYSQRNIEQMRQFYIAFSNPQTVSADLKNANFRLYKSEYQLSWSHYPQQARILFSDACRDD